LHCDRSRPPSLVAPAAPRLDRGARPRESADWRDPSWVADARFLPVDQADTPVSDPQHVAGPDVAVQEHRLAAGRLVAAQDFVRELQQRRGARSTGPASDSSGPGSSPSPCCSYIPRAERKVFLWSQRDPVNPGDRRASISPSRSRRRLRPPAVARQHCLERGRLPSRSTIEVTGDQARRGQPMLLGDPERGSAGGQLLKRHGTPRPPGRVE
jgi:hypothetical protein